MFTRHKIRTLAQDQRGATAVEYGLIVTLVVIACIAALKNFANANTAMWNNVAEEVAGNG